MNSPMVIHNLNNLIYCDQRLIKERKTHALLPDPVVSNFFSLRVAHEHAPFQGLSVCRSCQHFHVSEAAQVCSSQHPRAGRILRAGKADTAAAQVCGGLYAPSLQSMLKTFIFLESMESESTLGDRFSIPIPCPRIGGIENRHLESTHPYYRR